MPPRSPELDFVYKKRAEELLAKAIPNGECLECHYKSRSNGYAKLRWGQAAHRFVWEAFNGDIPEGLWVLHKCDNRPCINPTHLFLGTRQDNVDDMMAKGRYCLDRPRIITKEIQTEMLQLRVSGWSYNRLASKYGVTKQTIYKYVKGYLNAA